MKQLIFSNSVGRITDKDVRIKLEHGGKRTLELRNIVEVKYKHKRNYVLASVFFLVATGILVITIAESKMLYTGEYVKPTRPIGGRGIVLAFLMILGGLANLLGYYRIEIITKKSSVKLEDVEFNKLKEARIFIETLQKTLNAQSHENQA